MTPKIKRINKRLNLGRPVQSGDLNLVHCEVLGERVTFCVNMENDPIQRNHRKGSFYEQRELRALRAIFPEAGTFVDIGANVGNHTLFAALLMDAHRVIPFETNPNAYELLIHNVVVNGLRDVVRLDLLGVGLSDRHAAAHAMQSRERNQGGAMLLDRAGRLETQRADILLSDEAPDFIKIDVEGMEINVLEGLSGVLDRCAPIIMVEVDNSAEASFCEWTARKGYGHVATQRRYRSNKNHLIAPKNRVDDLKIALQGSVLEAKIGEFA